MSVWDVALTIINVILAIISGIGAYNSVNNSDYLQKARKYGHFTGYKN